ncbi:fumarylacetoacetate hydrolase family protein [Clostridium tagluense]|uniref:fumarylacetoacetate hydrolase family protein n=1 Tax=Clostridium tagluense TaxID=360422 RepID=UPI001CF14D11|nr:fumarylacetoacetate hydrolase family protein [Clostridium tagluense]MCB2298830.1 fumarylacetoacetate hydrolase family protein [Clostridium tagluense]
MKFVTYEYKNETSGGILLDSKIVPIQEVMRGLKLPEINGLLEFIEIADDKLIRIIESIIKSKKLQTFELSEVKLLAPIPYPKRNVFCIGKNYEDHAKEIKITQISDNFIPEYPIYFTKAASPAIATGDNICFSKEVTTQVDYEAELSVIIGKEGTNIKLEDVEEYIFGYTVVNDVSARDLQVKHKQWFKAKSLDTFCPMGPVIVHKNDIAFPVELNIQCRVNGDLRQNSNTRNMIFNIAYIVSDLSKGFTLKPGDIICTGTPAGVGMGFQPPKMLKDGDVVECYVENIGTIVNAVLTSKNQAK